MSNRKSATKEMVATYPEPAIADPEAARVGIRDLRDHLSRHLERVKAGSALTVTEHGRAIARIVPLADRTIEDLIASGAITPPSQPKADLNLEERPVITGWSLSDYVLEDRQERHADLLRSIGIDEDPAEGA